MFGFKKLSKEDRILHYLKQRKNKWVNGWLMVQYAKTLHHTQLISNLKKRGYNIQNQMRYNKRTKITETEYKLILN